MSGYNVRDRDGVVQMKPKFTDYYNLAYNKRGRVQLSVTQQLGAYRHALSGAVATRPTGSTGSADQQPQAGLNAAVDDINWTLSCSLTRNARQQGRDQMLALKRQYPVQPLDALRQQLSAEKRVTPATACPTI